ncbi:MAG: carnitine dehydratase [Alteromonadaceae bacterium]|uniref:CaiB/BaiF CoA transferase family protein n=1 Tax=Paraglaciecola chathamensis TaxID=368405 RepID=UPI000C656924|nr:CaiB/BaiF CoA-transferase family protein [Paraglaciecola agarilytica]MBN24898.1 carnitine dehydratase [Alteromonadaceae bacterium]|tara:strand:+ start:21562 stop:22698 length:1137 start_codon:yes stop_codon:yes gene_type:complete
MGPLQGIRVIELVGLGPGPFVGMLLADMGAEVIAVDRIAKSEVPQLKVDIHRRGKKSIVLDLKQKRDKEILLTLCKSADAIYEGFRPGVVEKLGIGPEVCMAVNPKLVYGRMTGWGQDGPLSNVAGHDINYIALTGALHAIGLNGQVPTPPLNLVGDYGGGMFLAFGLVCAILNARQTGKGQVVDAAMVDGVNILMSLFHSLQASGMWQKKRNSNFLDGGAPYYRTYETSDGKYISLGAIEKPFMRVFVAKANLPEEVLEAHQDPQKWPAVNKTLTEAFLSKTQQQWCDLLEGSDACFAPVLPFWEAHEHPASLAREGFIKIDDVVQPAPAPRFSNTQCEVESIPKKPGEHTESILRSLGYDDNFIKAFQICQNADVA